jgi:predicted CoA-binding protein
MRTILPAAETARQGVSETSIPGKYLHMNINKSEEQPPVPALHPTVAVIGASTDRSKYGNKAVRAFRNQGWEVYPVNPGASEVEGIPAYAGVEMIPVKRLDRASLYVPPRVGLGIIDVLAKMDVGEVWLNPGTASPELVDRAETLGLNVIQDCSILAIGENPGDY